MTTDVLIVECPVCSKAALARVEDNYLCSVCGLTVKEKKSFLGLKPTGQYIVQSINDDYSLAKMGIVGLAFTLDEVKNFNESVYTDQQLATFAEGNLNDLAMPSSTLAQILLEQLRETCHIQVNNMRRAHGPTLENGGNRFPQTKVPNSGLTWQDKGNLFLTNARLVFPSDSFTFIRMDRKVVGLQTFTNGIAIQRKGEQFATYFTGCRADQSALVAAYIQGKIPALRQPISN